MRIYACGPPTYTPVQRKEKSPRPSLLSQQACGNMASEIMCTSHMNNTVVKD
ncbi:hypothetical protein HYC85_008129 [Camellia sinensis]|uniref:Uncharacterized protein n=1 Tax=Camellia sinensis TaxID=4442 RepID=A0A7J7HR02_CAMSI|nr:hypothetical protein HYC85_008129 [Camellia sinensis]